jgi:hypothetical protein
VQKTHAITITVKYGDNNHTQITPRFKWFPQCEVHPLAEAITKKFTIKDGVQNIVERKSLRPKNPNTPKSHCHSIEIIPQKKIQKTEILTLLLLLGYDGGWSLFIFLFHNSTFFFLSYFGSSKIKKKTIGAL